MTSNASRLNEFLVQISNYQLKRYIYRPQTCWIRILFYPPKLTDPNKIIYIPETSLDYKFPYHNFHIHTVTDSSNVLVIRLEHLRHLHNVIYIRTSFIFTTIKNSILTHFFSVSILYIISSQFHKFSILRSISHRLIIYINYIFISRRRRY